MHAYTSLTMSVLAGWPLVLLCALLGLLFGSFANVAIHRWPRKGSVVSPPSHCPRCDTPIRVVDNIPLVSWLLLRGRCRTCGEPIAWRYPAVELLVAVIWALIATVHGPVADLPALLVLGWALVVASMIDLEFRIIPNRLTYRLAPLLLLLLVAAAAVDGAWGSLRRAIITGIALPAAMFALSEIFRVLRGQSGMGMGDVKLAASLGLMLGYLGGWEIVIGLYGAIIAAVIVAIGLLLAGKARMASRIPFGPYLAIGTLVAMLAGTPISAVISRSLGV